MFGLIKVFKRVVNHLFGIKEDKPVFVIDRLPVYKTRAQLILEGKSAYIPRRHMQRERSE